MLPLQRIAYEIFRRIRMVVAFGAKQNESRFGLRGSSVRLSIESEGAVYEEACEEVTLRVWASEEGPREAFYDTNVLGFIWARLSTEAADRCIGVIVGTVVGPEWVALRAGFGDLRAGGPIMMGSESGRPGVERFLEMREQFMIQAAARWAGREIDKHLGGGGCA